MRASNCAKSGPPETVLRVLRDSWVLSLQARNLSPATLKVYVRAANDLLLHLEANGRPATPEDLDRAQIQGLLAEPGRCSGRPPITDPDWLSGSLVKANRRRLAQQTSP